MFNFLFCFNSLLFFLLARGVASIEKEEGADSVSTTYFWFYISLGAINAVAGYAV